MDIYNYYVSNMRYTPQLFFIWLSQFSYNAQLEFMFLCTRKNKRPKSFKFEKYEIEHNPHCKCNEFAVSIHPRLTMENFSYCISKYKLKSKEYSNVNSKWYREFHVDHKIPFTATHEIKWDYKPNNIIGTCELLLGIDKSIHDLLTQFNPMEVYTCVHINKMFPLLYLERDLPEYHKSILRGSPIKNNGPQVLNLLYSVFNLTDNFITRPQTESIYYRLPEVVETDIKDIDNSNYIIQPRLKGLRVCIYGSVDQKSVFITNKNGIRVTANINIVPKIEFVIEAMIMEQSGERYIKFSGANKNQHVIVLDLFIAKHVSLLSVPYFYRLKVLEGLSLFDGQLNIYNTSEISKMVQLYEEEEVLGSPHFDGLILRSKSETREPFLRSIRFKNRKISILHSNGEVKEMLLLEDINIPHLSMIISRTRGRFRLNLLGKSVGGEVLTFIFDQFQFLPFIKLRYNLTCQKNIFTITVNGKHTPVFIVTIDFNSSRDYIPNEVVGCKPNVNLSLTDCITLQQWKTICDSGLLRRE